MNSADREGDGRESQDHKACLSKSAQAFGSHYSVRTWNAHRADSEIPWSREIGDDANLCGVNHGDIERELPKSADRVIALNGMSRTMTMT
jgi:hypothetical protein